MIYILIILLIVIFSWREIQILIDRGSYKKENLRLSLYWYLDQQKWYRVFDSFHVANGFIILIILWLIKDDLWQPFEFFEPLYVVVYWLIFMQLRNLFMWLIYRR